MIVRFGHENKLKINNRNNCGTQHDKFSFHQLLIILNILQKTN